MILPQGLRTFLAVVMDVDDPLQANRVRVKIFGLQDSPTTDMNDTDLIWALVEMPTTSAGVTGVGTTVHGLKKNSIVTVEFLDGEEMQVPLVRGVIQGLSSAEYSNFPAGFKPKSPELPRSSRIGQPDVSPYARGVSLPKDTSNGIPGTGTSKYPYNQVTESLSGHVIEIDDTPGNERIMIWHKSGSYTEHQASGSVVHSIKGTEYTHSGANVEVADGTSVIKVGTDNTITVGAAWTINAASANINTTGDTNINASGACNINASGACSVQGASVSIKGSSVSIN